ncbi:uncharacterized protein UTRI_04806 [Ustilago trichophora]|uniref:Uncharacterized protein n=1 Tax=Ustilago trichophora TaxID=86804 RepID=A0A5C3EGT6_9BASI|nr:uncharacterized protein UTRI_04806 [Ustilago trichophora]
MSEWSISLGWSAADHIPDSDGEDSDDHPLLEQVPTQRVLDEESVKFTETPFTIAARNAQVRKARQLVIPLDNDAGGDSGGGDNDTSSHCNSDPLPRVRTIDTRVESSLGFQPRERIAPGIEDSSTSSGSRIRQHHNTLHSPAETCSAISQRRHNVAIDERQTPTLPNKGTTQHQKAFGAQMKAPHTLAARNPASPGTVATALSESSLGKHDEALNTHLDAARSFTVQQTAVPAAVTPVRTDLSSGRRDEPLHPIEAKSPGLQQQEPNIPGAENRDLSETGSFLDAEDFETPPGLLPAVQPQSPVRLGPMPLFSPQMGSRGSKSLFRIPEEPRRANLQLREPYQDLVPRRAPSISSDVIVISSDSEEEISSTACRRGSDHAGPRPRQYDTAFEHAQITSEQVLQQLFDENHDFYKNLDREMTHQARSEASSSVRMESMVPDGSTSYETSSWAPRHADTAHHPHYQAPLQPSSSYPSHYPAPYAPIPAYGPVPNDPSRVLTLINAPPAVYDAYGRPLQYAHIGGSPQQVQMMGYPPGYDQASARPGTSSCWHPGHAHPPSMPGTGGNAWHSGYQQSWQALARSPPQTHGSHYPGYNYAGPSSSTQRRLAPNYAPHKTPRQAREAKEKADSLKGSNKRTRTQASSVFGSTASSRDKENEWSTLKHSRTNPDGTLSLTAAMRRPIPPTRLAQSSRGGSRLTLPLYRTPGSSAEVRRRAESLLRGSPKDPPATENSSRGSSSSKRTSEAAKTSKLFRPTPLSQGERNGAKS